MKFKIGDITISDYEITSPGNNKRYIYKESFYVWWTEYNNGITQGVGSFYLGNNILYTDIFRELTKEIK